MFPEVVARLRDHFDVETNDADEVVAARRADPPPAGQGRRVRHQLGADGRRLLAACPDLKAVCSMAVGYNNIDVRACTARGVLASNAPGVLTETTADLGFALMMAAARRVGESERFLRRGEWTRWAVDMFAGSDVHGATSGILGMGRIGQAIARRGALGFSMPVVYPQPLSPRPGRRGRARCALRLEGALLRESGPHRDRRAVQPVVASPDRRRRNCR
jgi:gluconate 2-dehydrogenase